MPELRKISNSGLGLICATGGTAIALTVLCYPFVSPALRKVCLPYVPATTNQVKNVMSLLSRTNVSGGRVIDLGSGDGRIVISAAQAGFKADGVELNPWLVAFSKLKAFSMGVGSEVKFYRKDLWKFSLKPYQNVIIFGVEEMMPQLENKLKNELNENAHVIACRFPFPSWKPCSTIGDGIDTVWLYKL